MSIGEIVAGIDAEIARLHQVKALLGDTRNGVALDAHSKRKRRMSADARAKIAEAQRKRWAKQKRANR